MSSYDGDVHSVSLPSSILVDPPVSGSMENISTVTHTMEPQTIDEYLIRLLYMMGKIPRKLSRIPKKFSLVQYIEITDT